MENNTIGKNLVYQRKLKGYSQKELSERTEVTVRTIQRIEKGDVQPHLQTVKLLAVALDVEVEDLIPMEDPKEESIQKKWLILLHGTPILGFILPLCNVLFPLFLWIHKREDNPIYNRHGVKIINFQISALLFYIAAFIALFTIEKWGFIFFISIIPLCLLIVLINIIYAVKDHKCYYPFAIPFLKASNAKLKVLLPICFPLMMGSCTSQKPDSISRLDGSTVPMDSLSTSIRNMMAEEHVTGMAVTVFDNNEAAYQETFGYRDNPSKLPLTDSTNIYGASFSKAVFSVLIMDLVEDGVIDLDTPLESYLPKKIYDYSPQTRWHDDYSALKNDTLYSQITARMCLAHTTGFVNWRSDEPDYQLKVRAQPGTRYSYSGEGFVYLQVVLEKLTGKGLQQLAEERIFEPLGMDNSAYQWESRFDDNFAYGHNENGEKFKKDIDNEPRGASTLETTAADYTRFQKAVLQERLLSEASYEELFSPQIKITSIGQINEDFNPVPEGYKHLNLSYGLGWGYMDTPYGRGVLKAGYGSGFVHYSILFPDSGKGIMIMTNSNNGAKVFKQLLEIALKDVYSTLKVA